MQTIELPTDDGSTCPTRVFHPDDAGPWPAVILFMDGIGIRPALFEMGERLAAAGYYVLLPDLFHRMGPYDAPVPAQLFGDPEVRKAWFARTENAASTATAMRDVAACLAHLAATPRVRPGGVGATGYCMGGRLALCAAGHFPDRIAAVASYHGGRLATDAPDSPHLLAARMKARVYIAAATDDASFPDDQKARLEQALTEAGVDHVLETYAARHGWVPSDTPVHDVAATERHWQTLLALLRGLTSP